MASSAEKKDVPVGGTATTAADTVDKPAATAENVPDPDEDDLDDLDDVLDEFNPTPAASGPGRPATAPPKPAGAVGESAAVEGGAAKKAGDGDKAPVPSEEEAEAFASALERQMAALMGEIESSPEMQAQLDAMMEELGTGTKPADSKAAKDAAAAVVQEAGATAAATGGDAAFQDTIRRTMERMQASGQQADAAAADARDTSTSAETDMLEALMREMAAGGGGEGGGGDDEFSQMLLGMMEQLTNKEILYEPMRDLHAKFPAWMEKNRDTVPKDDLARYEEQQRLVTEIVARFEREGYSDDNASDREFIVERMQKMQAAGSPPADLVGDMKETEDALGDLGQGCAQQ